MVCENCGEEFETDYRKDIGARKTPMRFCSRRCSNKRVHSNVTKINISDGMQKSPKWEEAKRGISNKTKNYWSVPGNKIARKVEWVCPICSKVILLSKSIASKRQYCSGTCRNKVMNMTNKGQRSKAEIIICDLLKEAGYKIDENRRDILDGLEIDIWIPSLNTGIEYNGIFHLQPIRGQEILEKSKLRDLRKKELAVKKGINLIVIEDETSNPKIVRELGKKLLQQLSKGV